uniref:Uncharacterized protein n=1 Tax=Candidatus Kentrum sp. DK TaxID=2126562 RepID=A0A450TAJ7_9GAMM|nr:MAG: hypothetical protein BECKDK2373B_GA0170837_112816 [Candidatus Kentron sp. DK]VFJ66370.1 MAG: hypothetical protein BECKDK2373C_GA0170839_114611 [Candidatus Kentron sp. DK]
MSRRQFSDSLGQIGAINRGDQGDVGNGILGKTGNFGFEQNVAGGIRPFQVARERDTDNRGNPATIQRITLNYNDRAPEARPRTSWFTEVGPPEFTLGDYHSTCRSTLRAAL